MPSRSATPGRRPAADGQAAPAPATAMRIGIDLGGTKVEGILLTDDGREVARRRVPTPRGDYGATLGTLADLVASLEEAGGTTVPRVGVGMPGVLSPATGLVKNANSTWLIGQPLDKDLAAALGRPVRIENDANCFAVSEATDGAGARAAVVFGVILGTGVGGGVVVRGRPLEGRNAIAGEWGHNPLPWPEDAERPGPACYCGLEGCIETFLSGPGLARDHDGGRTPAPAIVARAARGDAGAGSGPATLREPPGQGARQRHQPHRPGRHRPRRGALQHGAALRRRARAVGPVGVLGSGGHAP